MSITVNHACNTPAPPFWLLVSRKKLPPLPRPQDDLVLLTRRPLPAASALMAPPAPCVLGVVEAVAPDDGGWMVTLQVLGADSSLWGQQLVWVD